MRFPVTPLVAVPWSNGHDTWPTPRKRWFNSIRGYLLAQVRQSEERLGLNPGGCGFDSGPGHGPVGKLADHLGLEPGMLWVRVPPGPLETRCPRGAAWSARLPVTQEIAGSNPVEGAFDKNGAVRKSAKRPSSNLGDVRVRLPPAPLENMRRLGIGVPNCL